ncbi:hypothetical protein P3L10_026669 [Capsicum annuum]
MCPVSSNITVAPLEIITRLGRPPKIRRKEAEETKKSGKFSRTGLAMTCSMFHIRGHNKRGCPQSAPSVATATSLGKGRSRPKKTPPEAPNATHQGKSKVQARKVTDQRKIHQKHLMLLLKEKVMVQAGEEVDQRKLHQKPLVNLHKKKKKERY